MPTVLSTKETWSRPAYLKTVYVHNAEKDFQTSGTWTYNLQAFSEDDFVVASVGDRPVAASVGDRSVSASVGDSPIAALVRDRPVANSIGDGPVAVSAGDRSVTVSVGDRPFAALVETNQLQLQLEKYQF